MDPSQMEELLMAKEMHCDWHMQFLLSEKANKRDAECTADQLNSTLGCISKFERHDFLHPEKVSYNVVQQSG